MSPCASSRVKMTEDVRVSWGGGDAAGDSASTSQGVSLISLLRSPLEEERLTILFRDPLWEDDFLMALASDHARHQWIGFLFGAMLAIIFASRGSFVTWESKWLLTYTVICVLGNLIWVAIHFLRPDIAAKWRHPVAVILAIAIHTAIISLPPLAYSNYNTPSNVWWAVLLILLNSRFLQCSFTMGVWTAHGFLGDLALLTGVLFITLHWNADECQLLCTMQPGLGEYYMGLANFLVRWLGTKYVARDPVGMCLQVRYFLQGTCGVLVPVTLGYWREMKDRRAFALRHGVRLQRPGWRGVLLQLFLAYASVFFSVGIMTHIFALFPLLAHLPVILVGINPPVENFTCNVPALYPVIV